MLNSKRVTIAVIGLAGIISLGLFSAGRSRAQATNTFSNATLNDRYGFHVIAFHSNGKPFAISGYYQFNGNGTLVGKDVVSSGDPDQISPRAYTGSYQVNPDGTGTLQLNIAPNFQPTANFTIVEHGEAVELIFAVPGNMNAFTLLKQNAD